MQVNNIVGVGGVIIGETTSHTHTAWVDVTTLKVHVFIQVRHQTTLYGCNYHVFNGDQI